MSDMISRQAAIDAVNKICDRCGEHKKYDGVMCGTCYLDGVADIIEDLPSAQPERKKGKWIIGTVEHKYTHEHRDARQCSECGAMYFHYARQEDVEDVVPNFCPNCGADMRGEQE